MPGGGDYLFGPYRLDPRKRRLLRNGVPVPIQHRQFDLLHHFAAHPDTLITTDEIIDIVWEGAEVSDGVLTQALFHLRKLLDAKDPGKYIETVHREGYRFVAEVTRAPIARLSDEEIDTMLRPHRAFVDGRAAILTLEVAAIRRARAVFQTLVDADPENATFRVGLAIACALQFEATRADAAPDTAALAIARTNAREACRLAPDRGESWSTLGFVLERTGDRENAIAALLKAVTLEPDTWHHWLRLGSASWGEQRLRAAMRALQLAPATAIAYVLVISVYVARTTWDLVEREVRRGLEVGRQAAGSTLFLPLGLHWLDGLMHARRGDESAALAAFAAELALEPRGHVYAREMAANSWYASGACHLRRGETAAATYAFNEAIARAPYHPMAHAGLAILAGPPFELQLHPSVPPILRAMAHAAVCVHAGDVTNAAAMVEAALLAEPPGSAGWLIPLDPLLHVDRDPEAWQGVLALLRTRAA